MKVVYNGKLKNESDIQLPIANRAFNYGDGIFETILASGEKIYYLKDHFDRIRRGLEAVSLNFPAEFSEEFLNVQIKTLILENNLTGIVRIKIYAWRKSGGLFTPTSYDTEFLITAIASKHSNQPKEKISFYEVIPRVYSPLSRFKTLSSLSYIMAGIAREKAGVDDLILLDTEGNISETIACNIFWIKNNIVFTPSLEAGCIEGIMRKQILTYLSENNFKFLEGKFKKSEVMDADFIFTSNVTGLTPVLSIDHKKFNHHHELFGKLVKIFTV